MNKVGEFEKVSYEQFHAAMSKLVNEEYADEFSRVAYDALELPSRATKGSAGYDFKAPFSFKLKPGETMKIPTGIRVKIEDGWWLCCAPRSGLGFRYRLQLDNTVGVIDSDYYYSSNEGHIFAKITNDGKYGDTVHVDAGSGFMQGVFLPYGITYDDDAAGVRDGGLGSTG